MHVQATEKPGLSQLHVDTSASREYDVIKGLDSPPYQSGQFESRERKISKRGSPPLRRSLFRVMTMVLLNQSADDEVYQFMCKKRAEGKHYYVYMTAASNKFLRRYYGKVRERLLMSDDIEIADKSKAQPAA